MTILFLGLIFLNGKICLGTYFKFLLTKESQVLKEWHWRLLRKLVPICKIYRLNNEKMLQEARAERES